MTTATSAAPTIIDGLVKQLSICQRAIHRNLEGVSHEESMVRPQPGGNPANWVLGHIVTTRSSVLKNLGQTALLGDEAIAQYRRGSDGKLLNETPLPELLAALDRSQPLIEAGLRKFSNEELTAKSPFSSPAGPDATLAEALAALVFHEAYHVGQLGVLRRLCGKGGAI